METIFFQCAGDTILPVNQPRLTHENNLTTSELEYTPKIKDHGKILSCTANNGVFPKQNQSVELNVYYIPVVHIEILSEIDPSNIREGLSNSREGLSSSREGLSHSREDFRKESSLCRAFKLKNTL